MPKQQPVVTELPLVVGHFKKKGAKGVCLPSQILHALFGEDVILGLNSRIQASFPVTIRRVVETIKSCRSFFVLGCQGPDIFYHNRRTKPLALEYGILLHRRDYGSFSSNVFRINAPRRLLDTGSSDADALNPNGVYAVGFLTHAILDRFCHPYIIYKSCNLPDGHDTYHPFFERIIDVLMLKELRDQEVSSWNQRLLTEICENPPQGLKELIVHSLVTTYPERAGADAKLAKRVDNAFIDSARYYEMSDPAQTRMDVWKQVPVSRRHLSVIFPENLPADIDFLNLRHEPWYYPYQTPADDGTAPNGAAPKPDTRSFIDIYNDAVREAINILLPCIDQYFDSGIFPMATIASVIGNGSLSIQDKEGKPCTPNFCSPLPLDAVLDEQYRMRIMP